MSFLIRRYGNFIVNLSHFEAIEKKLGGKFTDPQLHFYGRQIRSGGGGFLFLTTSRSEPIEINFKTNDEVESEFNKIQEALERHAIINDKIVN